MNPNNKMRASTNNANRIIILLAILTLSMSSLLLLSSYPVSYNILAQNQPLPQKQLQQQLPNIKASNIYQTQTIVLGKNIKNFVILIPNEGHEDTKQTKEMRVINQPYIAQNAIVNVGTTVTWLNADAGHRHSITLVGNNNTRSTVYNSGRFDNFNASKPFTFNNLGTFVYSGPSYDRAFPNYKMNGTVTVVDQPLVTTFNNTVAASSPSSSAVAVTGAGASNNNNIDTIATLMVPSKLVGKTISDLKSQGLTIDNQYPFMSLRGGGSASGGDKQQVLLVLTSSGKNLNQVTSALAHVVSALPYK